MESKIFVEEFDRLPRWARVAFAARCARRVLPVFSLITDPKVHIKHGDSLRRAVMIAELIAAEAVTDPAVDKILEAVKVAERAAMHGASATSPAAASAIYAAAAARSAAEAAANPDGRDALAAASHAEMAAGYDNDYGDDYPADVTAAAVRVDFDQLMVAARQGSWDGTTSVAPEFFGPLWPEGKPRDWPG